MKIWHDKPASRWVEALPLGNGRLGAMIWGDPQNEQINLNDDTLYAGEPQSRDRALDVAAEFGRVVGWLRDGQYKQADDFISKNWLGRGNGCYQPLGDLHIEFAQEGEITNYRRELDISEAVARVSYQQNGVSFEREIFASHPASALVVRLTASAPVLDCTIRLDSPHPTAQFGANSTTPPRIRRFKSTATSAARRASPKCYCNRNTAKFIYCPHWRRRGRRAKCRVCARGGFEVALFWKSGKLLRAEIQSRLGRNCIVRYGEKTLEFFTEKNAIYRLNSDLKIIP